MAVAICASASSRDLRHDARRRARPWSTAIFGFLSALSMHLLLQADELLDPLLRHLQRLEHLGSRRSRASRPRPSRSSRPSRSRPGRASENSSCWKVGLRIQFPSTRPTRTAASGPFHGTVERLSAAEAATTPRMSASFSWSAESTVTKTCTSFLNPSGNSGRIERSISRAARISSSRRPALALEEPARDLARGVGLLAVFDGEGEEREGGDVGGYGDGGQHHRVAEAQGGGAGGLLREASGFQREWTSGELGLDPLHGHYLLSRVLGFLCCSGHINRQRASRCVDQDALGGVRSTSAGDRAAR